MTDDASIPKGSGLSRRAVLSGLAAAGVLVAAVESPFGSSAGASTVGGAAPAGASADASASHPEIRIENVRSLRLVDDSGDRIGRSLHGTIVDADGASIGTFAGTQVNGALMAHQILVGGSMLLGMGSDETFAVIGATGMFAGLTGGYTIDLETDHVGVASSGRLVLD